MELTHAQNREARDLTLLLKDLDIRADRIIYHLSILSDLDSRFSALQTDIERQDYIDVIRSHTEKMEADLTVIDLKIRHLNDKQIFDWINDGEGDTDDKKRQQKVMRLTMKMEDLQRQMAEVRKGHVDEEMVRERTDVQCLQESRIQFALRAIERDATLSQRRAAAIYDVPRRTLSDRCAGKTF
jgi:hypothetical protein